MKKLLLFGALAFCLHSFGQEKVNNSLIGSTYIGTFIKHKFIFDDKESVTFITSVDERYNGTYETKNEQVLISIPDYITSIIEFKIQDNCLLNKNGSKAYCREE